MKKKTFIIKGVNHFKSLIDNVVLKGHVYNVTGFYSKQHIYINIKCSNSKKALLIFDLSNFSSNFYHECLGTLKGIYLKSL